jgi:hypothetical protein
MARGNYPGKGNVAKFQAELQKEVNAIVKKGFPRGVTKLALELRKAAEEQTISVGLVATGNLASSWVANVAQVNPSLPAGEESSRSNLTRYAVGDEVVVYTTGRGDESPFYGWFHEEGWHDKSGAVHPALHFTRAAVERVARMNVDVTDPDRVVVR